MLKIQNSFQKISQILCRSSEPLACFKDLSGAQVRLWTTFFPFHFYDHSSLIFDELLNFFASLNIEICYSQISQFLGVWF